MNTPTRPGAGIIAKSLKTLKDHARTSFGFAAVICLPVGLAAGYAAFRPGIRIQVAVQLLDLAAAALVAYGIMLAVGLYEKDADPGVGGLLAKTFSSGLISFAVTRLLVGLLIAAASAIGMLAFLVAAVRSPEVFTMANPPAALLSRMSSALVLSSPLAAGLFLWAYLHLGLAGAASALESLSPIKSIARSRSVTKKRKADFFMVLAALMLVRLALSTVLAGPAAMVAGQPDPQPIERSSTNPFYLEQLKDRMVPERPLPLPAALIVGISTFLSSSGILTVSAAVLAQFFLALRAAAPENSVDIAG